MSNAAVINATNSSGQIAGSPITIETGGDVVLKLYGTGSGAWSITAAFAPVVDGITGAPITLTINDQQTSAKTSMTKTGATQWVGWIMQANGIWEASGLVEGYTGDEALSDHIGTFPSIAALPTKAVKTGTRATVGTSEYSWNGSAWVEAGGGGSTGPTIKSIEKTGNSIMATGDSISTENCGYLARACHYLNDRAWSMGTKGFAGQTSTYIESRFQDSIVANDPDVVLIDASVNDGIAAIATTMTKNLAMINAAKEAGITPVVIGLSPTSGAGNSAKVNAALQVLCAENGVQYIDAWVDMIDPATGIPKVGSTRDGLHPTLAYHDKAGLRISDAIILPREQIRIMQSWANVGDGGIFANPWNLIDTNADGIPDGWTETFNAFSSVKSISASGDGWNWFIMSGVNATKSFGAERQLGAVTPGGKILFRAPHKLKNITGDAKVLAKIEWFTSANASAGSVTVFDSMLGQELPDTLRDEAAFISVPATAAKASLKVTCSSNTGTYPISADLYIGRAQIWDVSVGAGVV